jgi:hypothetical protein
MLENRRQWEFKTETGYKDAARERERGRPRYSTRASRGANGGNWWAILKFAVAVCLIAAAVFYATKRFSDSKYETEFPASGDAFWYVNVEPAASAGLTIRAPTSPGDNYVVRLSDWETRRPTVLVPVRPGETATVQVPLGRYRVTMANGRRWLGPERLFGHSSNLREAVDPMEFYRVGNVTRGHTISLDSTMNGNMPTQPAAR